MYQYSCDGTLGVLQAQYSYYYKAKVFFPENVFQADNVFLRGYYGGFGTEFMSEQNVNPISAANQHFFTPKRRSIYCSLEAYNHGPWAPFLSVTGLKRDIGARFGVDVDDNNELEFNAPYFNKVYGFQAALHNLVQTNRATTDAFFPGSSPVVAFEGCTKYWNKTDQEWSATEHAKGYLPDRWYDPGLQATLCGQLVGAPNAQHKFISK